jgi:hypothetical protein
VLTTQPRHSLIALIKRYNNFLLYSRAKLVIHQPQLLSETSSNICSLYPDDEDGWSSKRSFVSSVNHLTRLVTREYFIIRRISVQYILKYRHFFPQALIVQDGPLASLFRVS